MESEKVKEIKKALEERTQHKPINCSHSEYVEACGMYCRRYREFVADMGIKNGQTCENCNKFTATDKVKEYDDILTLINELESENERLLEQRNKTYNIWVKDTEKLKDRIAEQEKEIAKNANCLKQFAEMLRGKAIRRQEFIGELAIDDVEYVKLKDIDETLKEFL